MKIFSICLIKNEADVIESCLSEASKWSDRVFVYDNGSTDGTWEKVCAMRNDIIVPWKSDTRVFNDYVRGDVFHEFRHEAADGDWWCRLDADEFYVQDPRAFLSKVPPRYHVVWGVAIEYFITRQAVEQCQFTGDFAQDIKNIRHYRAVNSEARFFKYRRRLKWNSNGSWPTHLGLTYPERILLRHYQFRSPQQMQLRIETRRQTRKVGSTLYWDIEDSVTWRDKLQDASVLHLDDGNGSYVIDEARLPDHLQNVFTRMLKLLMHGLKIWP